MDLNTTWFILVGVLFTGYAMLDGFDLGVGALHLFVKKDEDRRIFLNAIGPVWDGNEVWLVTGGGRQNPVFMAGLAQRLGVPVDPVEAEGWDGDLLEAECFAYLAIRSRAGLPLSLPSTTGVPMPMPGGEFWPA